MKFRRSTEANQQPVDTNSSKIHIRDLLKREGVEPEKKGRAARKIGIAAILASEAAVGLYIVGGSIGMEQDRPDPWHPGQVIETFDSLNHRNGHRFGYFECTPAPTENEMSAIINNAREIADQRAETGSKSVYALDDDNRFAVANELGLTLVSNEDLGSVMMQMASIEDTPGLSSQEVLQQANDTAGRYLDDQFDLDFEFIPYAGEQSFFSEAEYIKKLTRLLYNMSVLPKESYDRRVLWKIKIDSNPLIVYGTESTAAYQYALGTITFKPETLESGDTLIHELLHSYEQMACPDRGTNVAETFNAINKTDNYYVGKDYTGINPTTAKASDTYSAYSRHSPEEDLAESGINWVFTLDINALNPANLTPTSKKALVAAHWTNLLAPNLAEYMTTVSDRYLMSK